jgi:tetratricopeptide (TPR) repeat protein
MRGDYRFGRWTASSLAILTFWLACLPAGAAQEPAKPTTDEKWIGKRVVAKAAKLILRIDGEPDEIDARVLLIYRVEQVDEQSLLLKSLSDRKNGWVSADDVIPIDQAADYFSQSIRLHPNDPFPHAMLALVLEDKQEHEQAIRYFSEALRLDPKSAAAFSGRGTAWSAKGELDKAIADYDVAINLEPKNPVAFLGRGLTRAARSQHTLAIADFSEAIWLEPLSIAAYDHRGRAWQSKREYAKAIIDFNMVLRLDPQQASVYRRRGNCWVAEKRYGKAIADFNEAIRIDPGDALAYRELAQLLATCPDRQIRKAELALSLAKKACELTRWKDRAALESLAAVYAAARDFESAVNWQIKANALARTRAEQQEGEARLNQYREKRP